MQRIIYEVSWAKALGWAVPGARTRGSRRPVSVGGRPQQAQRRRDHAAAQRRLRRPPPHRPVPAGLRGQRERRRQRWLVRVPGALGLHSGPREVWGQEGAGRRPPGCPPGPRVRGSVLAELWAERIVDGAGSALGRSLLCGRCQAVGRPGGKEAPRPTPVAHRCCRSQGPRAAGQAPGSPVGLAVNVRHLSGGFEHLGLLHCGEIQLTALRRCPAPHIPAAPGHVVGCSAGRSAPGLLGSTRAVWDVG